MAVSKAQQKAVHKYVKANYDRMELTVPKGQKEASKTHAEARGESVNGFVNRAIDSQMERDGACEAAAQPTTGEVVSLPPEAIKAAQDAAGAAGETMEVFITRAVETQAKRDELGRRIGGIENA